jgi:hypothetical protein
MVNKMSELKRCPICNGKVVFEICHCKHEEWFGRTITCRHCDLIFYGSMDGMSEEQLAEEWNNRKPMERIVERLEEEKTKSYVTGITANPYEFGACHAMNDAIEIVKEEGGMNE